MGFLRLTPNVVNFILFVSLISIHHLASVCVSFYASFMKHIAASSYVVIFVFILVSIEYARTDNGGCKREHFVNESMAKGKERKRSSR